MSSRRADWDKDLTKVFLDLCIAEKEKLNYNCKKGLTKTGWKNLYRNFSQHTGKTYDRKQLQNKFNSLKRLFKLWRKLKNASGGSWDNTNGTITMDDDWWNARIAEDQLAETFRRKPLFHEHELTILFGSMDTEDGNILCVGGIGDRTPNGGSEDNHAPTPDDNVGRSCVGHASRKVSKDHVVESQPPKRTRSREYYVERISESMLEKNRNETSVVNPEQDEITQLLQVVEKDGVSQGSELYFIATELFMSAARRASFRTFRAPEHRISWLRWTWENARKK